MDYQAEHTLTEFKELADGPSGMFSARVAAFGNVDRNGDRLIEGAFKRTILDWIAKKSPIPVVWSHNHNDPDAFIGHINPVDLKETAEGLEVVGQMDVENPKARRIFDLLKSGRIKEWSFAYIVKKERVGQDKARELVDVDLLEVGPTLIGANPSTSTIALKSYVEAGGDLPDPEPDPLPEPAMDVGTKVDAMTEEAVAEFDDKLDALLEAKIGRAFSAKKEARIRAAIAELTELLDESLGEDRTADQASSIPDVKAVEEVPADEPGEAELLRRRVDSAGVFLAGRSK